MITENERDILAVLESITATRPLTDKIAAAMKRLLDQIPKPAAIDNRPDGERRKDFIEAQKGPKTTVNMGLVLPLPGPEETAQRELDMKKMAERAERMKRPFAKQERAT